MSANNQPARPAKASQSSAPIPAGEFSAWLASTRDNFAAQSGASVPCGQCTACCRSSQFVHIEADETQTLARIPPELLFPAPGQPTGTFVLGYDRNGHCPMLRDDRCSIYEDRPRTCRNYDCRVFAATAFAPSEDDKRAISDRVGQWQFEFADSRAHDEYSAVRAAAQFIREHAREFADSLPDRPVQAALLALKVYEVVLERGGPEVGERPLAASAVARSMVAADQEFEEMRKNRKKNRPGRPSA